jgi:hypothetical protein
VLWKLARRGQKEGQNQPRDYNALYHQLELVEGSPFSASLKEISLVVQCLPGAKITCE